MDDTPRQRLTRAEQQAKTRAALIDAARRVFLERGFAGASVKAIATEAGYTRGAFYSNFDSKEEVFVELIREQGYRKYAQLAMDSFDPSHRPGAREVGERLAAIQGDADVRWAFQLWFELIAQAGRDDELRQLAASFWTGNRALAAAAIGVLYQEAGKSPPAEPERLASALIALDIGLAIQHYVDPDAAPLDLYPELFELLFGRMVPGEPPEDG